MLEIPVSGGRHTAFVDDEDFQRVAEHRWSLDVVGDTEYARCRLRHGPGGRECRLRMHTLVTGWPYVDHHDRNGLNNQRSNLREATGSLNGMNRRSVGGASRFKGVFWEARTAKWRACIKKNGLRTYLGSFMSEEAAARAYDQKALEMFGDFALTNERQGLFHE